MQEVIPGNITLDKVDIWFQDEARVMLLPTSFLRKHFEGVEKKVEKKVNFCFSIALKYNEIR